MSCAFACRDPPAAAGRSRALFTYSSRGLDDPIDLALLEHIQGLAIVEPGFWMNQKIENSESIPRRQRVLDAL